MFLVTHPHIDFSSPKDDFAGTVFFNPRLRLKTEAVTVTG